ncbi:hypothetical protein IAT38_001120 [Cryptococcus sp. DSM 104549]
MTDDVEGELFAHGELHQPLFSSQPLLIEPAPVTLNKGIKRKRAPRPLLPSPAAVALPGVRPHLDDLDAPSNAPSPIDIALPTAPKIAQKEPGEKKEKLVGQDRPYKRKEQVAPRAEVGAPSLAEDDCSSPGGIKSSTFCKVLRILSGIPLRKTSPPSPKGPKPLNRPPVWAESRQELCEALPYYRSFQSGLYMYGRVAFGYLLEAYPAPRDVWAHNGRVVISHGGGQCIRTTLPDGRPGPAALQADQAPSDARVDTLLNACERRTPIILIAGSGYEGLPWTLDCAYAVLGWYWVCCTWVEAEPVGRGIKPPKDKTRDYFHRYKIRFDWCQSQESEARMGEEVCASSVHQVSDGRERPMLDTSMAGEGPSPAPSSRSTPCPPSPIPLALSTSEDGPSMPEDTPSTSGDIPPMPEDTLPAPEHVPPTPEDDPPEEGSSLGKEEDHPGMKLLAGDAPLVTSADLQPSFLPAFTCLSCSTPSPTVYSSSICLNAACPAFFLLPSPLGLLPIPPGWQLTFNPDFLLPIATPLELERLPYGVIPPDPGSTVPRTEEGGEEGEGEGMTGRTLWRGWVCKECGRANCRYRWEVWECRNCESRFAPIDPERILSPESLLPANPPFLGDAITHPASGIRSILGTHAGAGAVVALYELPEAGRVIHLMPTDRALADRLLETYQHEAASAPLFQRRALKASAVKGSLLAQHFAINSGAPYKYIVNTLSVPFEDSPACVTDALEHITTQVDHILNKRIPFNEILSVMYREGQKMSWHDDGEAGLGPVVASLSLGSPAVMSFRAKSARQDLNTTFYKGESAATSRSTPPVALSITLSHGDIMIMQGSEVQKRYVHRVLPQGFRIAATARTIGVV